MNDARRATLPLLSGNDNLTPQGVPQVLRAEYLPVADFAVLVEAEDRRRIRLISAPVAPLPRQVQSPDLPYGVSSGGLTWLNIRSSSRS